MKAALYSTHHSQMVWHRRWFKIALFMALVLGAMIIYFQNLEMIPYLKRTCFLIIPKHIEREGSEWMFNHFKEIHQDEILPSVHPESVRIRRISEEILGALRSDLSEERVWKHNKTSVEEEGYWEQKRIKSMIRYLECLNWEFVVVRDPMANAINVMPGKIVIFTGMLDLLRSDAEIAFVLGHEVGHTVSRFLAEKVTKFLWFALFQLIPNRSLPFQRRAEIEAEYIGLMLVASAGYDPRVSLTVNEKYRGKTMDMAPGDELLSTHPSGRTVKRFLTQTHVMEEALAVYMAKKQIISS